MILPFKFEFQLVDGQLIRADLVRKEMMLDETMIERAISIAVAAHKKQRDLGGKPYILHPLRLMCQFENEDAQIVAVLHDVVEDTHITLNLLQQHKFKADIIVAIDCITKRKGEPYSIYLDRVATNPLATAVKLMDLRDNCNFKRLGRKPTEKDRMRLEKYNLAIDKLTQARILHRSHDFKWSQL